MAKSETRFCEHHGLTTFSSYGKKTHFKCSKCMKYRKNKKRYDYKQKCVDYKGGKCELCGYDKCIDALDFHHIDPDSKEISIGDSNNRIFENVKSELDKCILLCSNCHREVHSVFCNTTV